jgi:hypothetical protein
VSKSLHLQRPWQLELENRDASWLVELLKRAVEKHGVEAHNPKDHPGLNDAYKKGYLQAIFTNDSLGRTLYAFPTALHHR